MIFKIMIRPEALLRLNCVRHRLSQKVACFCVPPRQMSSVSCCADGDRLILKLRTTSSHFFANSCRKYSNDKKYEIVDDRKEDSGYVFYTIYRHVNKEKFQSMNMIFSTFSLSSCFLWAAKTINDYFLAEFSLQVLLTHVVYFGMISMMSSIVYISRTPVLDLAINEKKSKVKITSLHVFGRTNSVIIDIENVLYKKGEGSFDKIQVKGTKQSWLVAFSGVLKGQRFSVRKHFKVK